MIDSRRLARRLLSPEDQELVGGYSPNPEIIDRASLLPIGQYEDGSLTLAVPGMVKDTWDSFNRGLERQGAAARGEISREQAAAASAPRRTGPNAFEFELGDTVTTAMTPITGNLAGSLFGAIPDGALGVGASKPPTAGIRAYHGSPHDFDKFSLDKIGTGEGAQAYGHGLYFAESEGIAKHYRDALTPKTTRPSGTPLDQAVNLIEDTGDVATALAVAVKNRNDLVRVEKSGSVWDLADYGGKTGVRSELARTDQIIDVLRNDSANATAAYDMRRAQGGRLYEVRIDAEPEQFLDWDKPLAEQSEAVRNALVPLARQEAERELKRRAWNNQMNDRNMRETWGKEPVARPPLPTADELALRMHGNEIGPGNEAALRQAGIPGIRYLDGGSRSAGEGSHNYVVFDENLIDILRKYGLLGTAGLGAGLLGGGGEANATGLLGSSAPDPDNDPMSILQRYGLLEPPAEDVPRPPVIGPGRPDPFDRYNDPFFEVPEIINNPFSDPPRPPLPRLRRPLPFRLGPPTG